MRMDQVKTLLTVQDNTKHATLPPLLTVLIVGVGGGTDMKCEYLEKNILRFKL